MALRFKKATAVAVGTFNIYVIQPKWLVEVGVWPDFTHVQMASDLNRPGFRYRSEKFNTQWEVRPDRLILHTERTDENCGALLAAVLERLPWTPLFGIGVNAEYQGAASEITSGPASCSVPSCTPPEGYYLKQRTAHVAVTRGDHVFNLQLLAHQGSELSINVHTDLKGKPGQENAVRAALEACRQFIPLRQEAVALASRIFGLELEP